MDKGGTVEELGQCKHLLWEGRLLNNRRNREAEEREFYDVEKVHFLNMFNKGCCSAPYMCEIWRLYNNLFKVGTCDCFDGDRPGYVAGGYGNAEAIETIIKSEVELNDSRARHWEQYRKLILHGGDAGRVKDLENNIASIDQELKERHFEVMHYHAKRRLHWAMDSVDILRQCLIQLGLKLKQNEETLTTRNDTLYQIAKALDPNAVRDSSTEWDGMVLLKSIAKLRQENEIHSQASRDSKSENEELKTKISKMDQLVEQEKGNATKYKIGVKAERENCRKAIERCEKFEKEIKHLKDQCACQTKQVEGLSKQWRTTTNQLELKQREIKEMKTEYETAIAEKDKTTEQLTQRLSAEMSQKISACESNLENISIKERPMNIATDYEYLCSNDWLNAKTALDELTSVDDRQRIELLRETLIIAESEATNAFTAFKSRLLDLLTSPLSDGSAVGDSGSKSERTEKSATKLLPPEIVNSTGDFLRVRSGTENVGIITSTLLSTLEKTHQQFKDVLLSPVLMDYIHACARVAWKMALQRPPMTFRQTGIGQAWAGELLQRVYWNSADPKDPRSRVAYYVHPALYHDEAAMVPGRVVLELTH